jgi:hypothetical protein
MGRLLVAGVIESWDADNNIPSAGGRRAGTDDPRVDSGDGHGNTGAHELPAGNCDSGSAIARTTLASDDNVTAPRPLR